MSIAKIPPGQTWFDIQKGHYGNVSITSENEVSTIDFLAATEATTTMFDYFGSVVFKPIKQDLLFNIDRVRAKQLAAPNSSLTLQALVKDEASSSDSQNATEGLTWLVRGLDFMAQAFRADLNRAHSGDFSSKDRKELADSFKESYKTTLSPHHNWLIRPIFRAAMNAAPYRKDFYRRLGGDDTDEVTTREALDKWVSSLEKVLEILKTFLSSVQP